MDGSGRSEEKDSIKVGDIEKEKEIERRLRELGLWENKRLLESRVASMLDAHIEEQDALSRTLRKCRRRRAGEDGGGGKTAVEEIRNIISPRVIRDCYGQKLAYQVNILMGCFTKNIEHEVINDVVIIRGSTAVDETDPKRLTKELRLELPPSLNMAALHLSYAAGAVKIRVPYVIELPPSLKRSSESTDVRPYKLPSISPIYSLNMALNSSANRTKLGSSGADSLSSESPNSATSLLSPMVPMTSDSLADSNDLQPRSSIPESPTTALPSPFPVFEDDTSIAFANASEKENDQGRCANESKLGLEGTIVGEAPTIRERYNGFTSVSERGSVDSDKGRALSEEVFHKSLPQEECPRSTENAKRNTSIGQRISGKLGRTLVEEYHNGSLGLSDSNNLVNAVSNRAQTTFDETVDSKSIDGRLGNNLRNRASANMAAIYVNIPDSRDISVADYLDGAKVMSKQFIEPKQLTSGKDRTSKYAPDHSNWSSSDHSKPALRGSEGGNRWRNEGTTLVGLDVLSDGTNSAQRDLKWKTFTDGAEIRNQETSNNEGVQMIRSNTLNRLSTISAERKLNPFEELDKNFVNGRRENANKIEYDTKVTKNNSHYDDSSATDLGLHDKSHRKEKGIGLSKNNFDRAAFQNDYDHEEQFSFTHSGNGTTIRPQGTSTLEKNLHKKTYSSVQPFDDNGVAAQEKAGHKESAEKNSFRKETTENDKVGDKEERSSIANYHGSGKVTSEVNIISDKVSIISSNGANRTGPFKQNSQREEQGEAGFRSVTEDSHRVAPSSKGKMSPTPKKPIKILDYLLDSLDETVL